MNDPCNECGFVIGQRVTTRLMSTEVIQGIVERDTSGCKHRAKFDNGLIKQLPDWDVFAAPCPEHKFYNHQCAACNREIAGSKLLSKDKDGKLLYAITLERWNPRLDRWEPYGFEYVHAANEMKARMIWEASKQLNIRVLAIAPVIGYNVHDNHGEKLSV